MRTTGRRLALIIAGAALFLAGCNMTPAEQQSYTRINELRSSVGLPGLLGDDELTNAARAHSEAMGARNELFHSDLAAVPVTGWLAIGENVAHASTVEEAMATLEASPTHRANMLSASFNHIGIGIYVAPDTSVWLTQLFTTTP